MRKFAFALLLVVVGAPHALSRRAQGSLGAQQPAAPKLVVVLVVDQMRTDYIDQFRSHWTGGLGRLVDRGAWFRRAAYPYLGTVTCAGHSTISTGTFPATHGMVQNAWWDREGRKMTSCTEDPNVALISYGAPAKGGDSPGRIAVPTFADQLRAQQGAGPRAVTFSLKARSAIGLAGRAANAVTWFDDGGSWVTSTAYPSAPVPFIKDFIQAHPVEHDFGVTWTKLLRPDEYAYQDDAEGERPPPGWTTTFPHVLKGARDTPDGAFYTLWQDSPFSDAYLGSIASAAVDALRLGHGPATDYLGVSFSALDLVGHAFGPRSHEIQDVLARLDRTIGALLDHLDRAVGADQYVVALTADHGVAPIPEQEVRAGRAAGRIDMNVIAARTEQALKIVLGDGRYVSQANYSDVYFEPGVYKTLLTHPQALESAMNAIRSVPGVLQVFRGDQLPAERASKDRVERAAALSYFSGRSGDLIVAPKPYWFFGSANTAATHGSANDYDQRVPVVLMGAGIKAGAYQQVATPADIAPTLAALCGITMPKAEGHVLREALRMVPTTTRSVVSDSPR